MTRDDVDQVAQLTGELGYPSSAADISRRFAEIERQARQAVFVADEAGIAIGWLHIAIHPLLERDRAAEVLGLVVGSAHRGLGVGRALLAAAEDWARGQGCAAVRLRSRITRERAHAFYEKQGYQRVKTQHCFEKTLS